MKDDTTGNNVLPVAAIVRRARIMYGDGSNCPEEWAEWWVKGPYIRHEEFD